MELKEIEVYKFSELDDDIKEKVRAQFREDDLGYDWHDPIYEDAKEVASLMGIDIEKILFSGFYSQGDGACFKGSYAYKKGSVKAVKEYAPLDKDLHAIVEGLARIQNRY